MIQFLFRAKCFRRGLVSHLDKIPDRKIGKRIDVWFSATKVFGERALAAEMATMLSRQIAALAEPAALDRLADAASRLHEARRVYCLGLRSCHAAAWHFHYMLSLLGDKTVMLDDAGGTGLDAIRDALYASKIIAYAQGFEQMSVASAAARTSFARAMPCSIIRAVFSPIR